MWVVDFPFKLVDQSVLTDGDIQLDHDAHLVVFISIVGHGWLGGDFIGINLWAVVTNLFSYARGDSLNQRATILHFKAKVFDQFFGKVVDAGGSVVKIPGKGIAQFDLTPVDVESDWNQIFGLLGLDGLLVTRNTRREGFPLARTSVSWIDDGVAQILLIGSRVSEAFVADAKD